MVGGWFSFGGFQGQARYHDTPVEECLPVLIKDGDDRRELPEGWSGFGGPGRAKGRPRAHGMTGRTTTKDIPRLPFRSNWHLPLIFPPMRIKASGRTYTFPNRFLRDYIKESSR